MLPAVAVSAQEAACQSNIGCSADFRCFGARLKLFSTHPLISAVQVVVGAGQEAEYEAATSGLRLMPPVKGGDTRQNSVRNGLRALAGIRPDFVLIHDAARPLVSRSLIEAVIAALESGADAVLPVLPIVDLSSPTQ